MDPWSIWADITTAAQPVTPDPEWIHAKPLLIKIFKETFLRCIHFPLYLYILFFFTADANICVYANELLKWCHHYYICCKIHIKIHGFLILLLGKQTTMISGPSFYCLWADLIEAPSERWCHTTMISCSFHRRGETSRNDIIALEIRVMECMCVCVCKGEAEQGRSGAIVVFFVCVRVSRQHDVPGKR